MKHPDDRALKSVMSCIEHSPRLRRFLWGVLCVAALYALPDLITALRG